MATHSGGLTDAPGRSEVRGLHRSFGESGGVLDGLDLEIARGRVRGAARPQRLRQEHAAARPGRARPRRRRHGRLDVPDERSRWSSRTPGCCPGSGSWTTSSLGLRGPGAADRGRAALAEVGLAGRETGLAARALGRRAAARRPRPLAGARARAPARRRAVRRARRTDPDPHARPAAPAVRGAPPGGAAGHPRRRRGDRAGRPGARARRRRHRGPTSASTCRPAGSQADPRFAALRASLLRAARCRGRPRAATRPVRPAEGAS